jgi:integrase
LLGVRTGFRISELLSLRVQDVMQHGKVLDRVTVQSRPMKGKTGGRTLVLHPEAKAALSVWLEVLRLGGTLDPDTFVFKSRNTANKVISRVQAWGILSDALEANGLAGKLGTHCMRKTFANRVYDQLNGRLEKVQRALGHKNINPTVSHLSFREEEIDAAILAA